MLKLVKWVRHDPFGLFFNLYDDIACLEMLGSNIILQHEEDGYEELDDDDDDFYDDDEDDEDDEDDYDDFYDDEDDDDTDDYDLDSIITSGDRWIVCEDDHYSETEDIIN